MTRYVGQLVGRLVSVKFFRRLQAVFALLLLPNCLNNLFYHCPCPPARDFGSRVYGLVRIQQHIEYTGNKSSAVGTNQIDISIKKPHLHNAVLQLTFIRT